MLRAWQQLGGLHTVLLALLVAEVAVVQLGVLAWQFALVRALREQHTRLFAAFLALPSAVMRSMASRWADGLLGCWAAGLLGCWAAGLLGCWAAGLLGGGDRP